MKKKNWIVVALCVAIVGMGIGFAALAQNLQISATANITGEWDVRIVEIFPGHSVGATNVGSPGSFIWDGTSATFEVELEYPGAFAYFAIRVENHGNIPAALSSVTGVTAANSMEPSEIQFTVGPWVDQGDGSFDRPWSTVDLTGNLFTLNPGAVGGTPAIVVKAEWIVEDGVESTIPDVKSKAVTINLNYVQAT